MMINKRLINMAPDSKDHIKKNIGYQLVALIANIAIMFTIADVINSLYEQQLTVAKVIIVSISLLTSLLIKLVANKKAVNQSYLAAKDIKLILRRTIYQKLLRLGSDYAEKVSTAEVVQASVEGVEQLETYFGAYLPQFFYSLIAPIILFFVLAPISLISATVLFLCVPLIPLSIMVVQKFAKKILAKYWGEYVKLGSSFLENLQGLTILKIYQADQKKHNDMNVEAEHFRKITMKVLTMQLNSITLMDWIAYGGAALGIIMAVSQFSQGKIELGATFLIIMLAADFFLPLRLLGSYFHIAMNGMAASEKIFNLLDLAENPEMKAEIKSLDICLENVGYSYDGQRQVLTKANLTIPKNSFVSIVGESGSGKSTIAKIISGQNLSYSGSVKIGDLELKEINQKNLKENICSISNNSYIFKGTVRDNLLMAAPRSADEAFWQALEKVNLAEFLRSENGLDTVLSEQGANFSGGQRQRLAVARALVSKSKIFIFDEATSNIDVESENDILRLLHQLATDKTIILISHRLANVVKSDTIYVIANGEIKGNGKHEQLLKDNSVYKELWQAQSELEAYRGGQYE